MKILSRPIFNKGSIWLLLYLTLLFNCFTIKTLRRNKMSKSQKISLALCLVVFIMAVVGSIMCFGEIYITPTKPLDHGIRLLKFFTVQSNILGGITAFIYIVYLIRENKTQKPIPVAVRILRYIATIDLIITFLVVALFLGFIYEEGYFLLFVNANFFFHFAIPVINFISFTFFEDAPKMKIKQTLWGLVHMVLYSIFYMTVVITHFHDGAVDIYYDWYAFAQKGLAIAFVCAAILYAITYGLAFLLYKLNNRRKE